MSAPTSPFPSSRDDFQIAVICALPEERDTVEALMTRLYKSEGRTYGKARGDDNTYTTGVLGGKPVVLVAPRAMGTTNTRHLAVGLRVSFPNILYALVVGIAGGAAFIYEGKAWKESDIQLGDVIVSTHVIEYDFGKEYENGFRRRTDVESVLPRAPAEVTNFINQFVRGRSEAFNRVLRKTNADVAAAFSKLEMGEDRYYEHPGRGTDHVYDLGYRHKHQDPNPCTKCSQCTEWYHEVCDEALQASCHDLGCQSFRSKSVRATKIHFGRYASGNAVMKSGHRRDLLIREEQVIGFEMEGAGAWEVFGTIIIKGVVDYADSHKSKRWRGYPAARAALCAAAMIEEIELPDRPQAAPVPPTSIDAAQSAEQPWLLPRPASQQYIGYIHVLERLKSCLLSDRRDRSNDAQAIFVLSGMGGVGKSETVLQFLANNDRALREKLWAAFWVDCSSEASARAGFKQISSLCGWPQDNDQVLGNLARSTRPYLLIIDNCDDAKADYSRYIPPGSLVTVILTTRLSDARKYASRDPQDAGSKLFIRLEGLSPEAAVGLVLEASETEERDQQTAQEARKLVTALDYHPLAIIVASSLIRSGIYLLGEYVSAIEGQLGQQELLETESEQARYKKVGATFEVSAQYLISQVSADPSAKDALALLDVLAFVDRREVTEDLFTRAWSYEEEVLSESEDEEDGDANIENLSSWHVARCRTFLPLQDPEKRKHAFRKARGHLERLSLVILDGSRKSMSLHPLVHAWARERISSPGGAWAVAASLLALSAQGRGDWQRFSSEIARHYEISYALWIQTDDPGLDKLELCRIWFVFGWQMYRAHSLRTLEVSKHLLMKTRELVDKQVDDLQTAAAQHLLGLAYQQNGQVPEAVELLEHVVQVRKRLAEDHPNRLASQYDLAISYKANGQVVEAIQLLEHVVQVRERLAEDHPDRLASQHELAGAYQANGQVIEAVELLEHVVQVRERLAEDHPDRLASQHELASAYKANGQVKEAVELLEHVVQVEERLAEDHPSRLASQHALASAYWADGQISKAMELMEHVVQVKQRTLRAGHPARNVSEKYLAFMVEQRKQSTGRDHKPRSEEKHVGGKQRTLWKTVKLALRSRKKG